MKSDGKQATSGRAFLMLSVILATAGCTASPEPSGLPVGFSERTVAVGSGEWAVEGNLTLPEGSEPVPAVVLMHGSGPGTRDGDVGPNKVYRELAWGLAAHNIAVLRYDKRTTAYAERFRSLGREPTIEEEHTDDGVAAVQLLRTTPGIGNIFILAVSQSTAVAADVAECAGGVSGLVLVSVGARSPLAMIIEQTTYADSLSGSRGDTAGVAEAREYRRRAELMLQGDAPDTLTLFGRLPSYWDSMDPQRSMARTEAFLEQGGRLLVVHGARDYLTTEMDIGAWEAYLGTHRNASFRRYPELNHLMQPGTGRMTPEEYEMDMEVSSEFVEDVAEWIHGL